MFKQRLITSLILIPIVLLALFYAPSLIWVSLITIIIVACGLEWLQLIPLKNTIPQTFFMLGIFLLLAIIYMLSIAIFHYWLILGLLIWMAIIIAEISFPESQAYWGYPLIVILLAYLLLPLVFKSLILIYSQPQGKALFLYLLFIVWAADIGAYLTGKQWGKHKLIPYVSPGKSWEGAFGGLVLTLIVAYVGCLYFHPVNKLLWFVLAFSMFVISIAGDLFMSMLKRRVGLKDTGTLIPGHGGFLDRLDSLIAVSPLFYFGLTYSALGL